MFKRIKSILHSLIAKIVLIIFGMALAIILSVFLFNSFIFHSRHNHGFFLLAMILIIIFVTAGFFFHRLIRPIQALNKGVKEIGKGNLDFQLKINGSDEIGQLAKAFNQMSIDLKRMLESRDQLLLDVSHELRTPLTRAKLALEMTEECEYIISAKRNIKEVEIMISELLESQRLRNSLDEIEFKPVNLKKLLEDIQNEYIYDEQQLVFHPINEKLKIKADEKLIKIVLRNIIDNALKYSPKDAQPIEISVSCLHKKISIQIEDFGDGLSPEEIEKVFEPFYRTDKSRSRKTGGYGLGLHLCKRIMEAHSGEISLENKTETKGLKANLIFFNQACTCEH